MMSPAGDGPGSAKPPSRLRSVTLDGLWASVEELVSGSHLFRSLEPETRQELVASATVQVYPSGRVILREGSLGDEFYVVEDGVVEVSTKGTDGSSVSLSTLQRGAFFGEVAMLMGTPRTASVTALTDVILVRFDREDVSDVLARHPKAQRLLQAVIAGRARDAAEKVSRAAADADDPPNDKAP